MQNSRLATWAPLVAVLALLAVGAGGGAGTVAGRYFSTAPTLSNGQSSDLRVTSDGLLMVASGGTASIQSSTILGDGTEADVQYAKIALASASATEVVPAVASTRIVVVGFKISASAALNIKWVQDTGGTPTDLSGLTYLAANGGWTAGYPDGAPVRLYATSSGNNLGIDSSAADATSVEVWYVEDPD